MVSDASINTLEILRRRISLKLSAIRLTNPRFGRVGKKPWKEWEAMQNREAPAFESLENTPAISQEIFSLSPRVKGKLTNKISGNSA